MTHTPPTTRHYPSLPRHRPPFLLRRSDIAPSGSGFSRRRSRFFLLILATTIALPLTGAAQTIQSGDLVLSYTPDGGAALKIHGTRLSFGGSLWAVSPDWGTHYYGSPLDSALVKSAVVDNVEGGQRLTLHHSLGKGYPGDFEATETFLVKPDDTLTATLSYHMTRPSGAILEWGVAELWTPPLAGMPARIKDANGEQSITLPFEASNPDFLKSVVAKEFTRLTIQSRLGPIEIDTSPGSGVVLSDYRKNKYADPNRPMMWLGCYEQPIVYGKTVTKSVTLRFPKTLATPGSAVRTDHHNVEVQSIADALPAERGRRPIVPTPKEFKAIDSRLVISAKTKIYLGRNPGQKEEKALAFLLNELKSRYGIALQVVRDLPPGSSADSAPEGSILLGESWRFPLPKDICAKAGLSLPDDGQGYTLLVNDKSACVASATGEGLFNGVTTLVQLLAVDGDTTFLYGAAIRDWPALDFRGVHCFTGKGRGDELARAVRDLMARFKINKFVWEVEYLEWQSHPEIWNPQCGMSKAEARKVVVAARDNLVEIIPMISSLGHFEWVFKSGHHLDLAEDPDRPYAYAVSDPNSYSFIHDIFQEALDFFHPRILHLGHDEVTMRGRYPWRSRNLGDTSDLFLIDMQRHVKWLKQRGVEAMIWSDMALAPGEAMSAANAKNVQAAKEIRDEMSKDVLIGDWHYDPAPPEKFTSLALWKKSGYKVIGCGWDNPVNIANEAKACVDQGALGYLQTTWAGYNFGLAGNEENWRQYWAWVLAAQYAWTGVNSPVNELPFDVKDLFLDTVFPEPLRRFDRPGFFVDLRSAANCSLVDTPERTGWLGFGPQHDFSALQNHPKFHSPVRFAVRPNAAGKAAVLLSGAMDPKGDWPRLVEIRFSPAPVQSLHFLMNSSYAEQQGLTCGEIVILYEDGGKDSISLNYGVNLFAPSADRIGANTRLAWRGKTEAGETIRAWDLEWRNPKPDRKVSGFTISSKTTCAAPALFAVTGVESGKSKKTE